MQYQYSYITPPVSVAEWAPPEPEYTFYVGSCAHCGESCNGRGYDAGMPNKCSTFYTKNIAWVCANCVHLYLKLCPECEENYIKKGEEMCEDCDTVSCEGCGYEYQSDSDDLYVDSAGNYYCCDCVSMCDSCGDTIFPYEDTEGNEYITLHQECYYENYRRCTGCGEIFHNDDLYAESCGCCYYCDDCDRGTTGDNPLVFLGDDDSLYMGVELEMDDGRYISARDAFADMPNADTLFFKITGDGSLSHDGLEIATTPCTLKYHQTEFPWQEIRRIARRYGYRSHNARRSCGIHIHVNKDALLVKTQLKLAWFISSQQENMEHVARRTENQWSYFKKNIEGPTDETANTNGRGRYEALNWRNRRTVEFRLYKGSLRVETILGTIDLTHAIIRYVEQAGCELLLDKPAAWAAFIQYVKDHQDTYPNGWEYLVYRELAEE